MKIDDDFAKILELVLLLDETAAEPSENKQNKQRLEIYEKMVNLYQGMLDKHSKQLFEFRKELTFYYRTYPQVRQQYLDHLQHDQQI